ncbi:hypothetical protein B0T14DRAFT_565526 [Immersiella caudata]|uniref:Uncharacterized protein n=1 Tax=Immersiella caudata TaxID=314043 RepID=A0AA39WYZ6_9PEZI|nr:hypothetical protein B0T14DRAFT_565526 [Immersiella caudata]
MKSNPSSQQRAAVEDKYFLPSPSILNEKAAIINIHLSEHLFSRQPSRTVKFLPLAILAQALLQPQPSPWQTTPSSSLPPSNITLNPEFKLDHHGPCGIKAHQDSHWSEAAYARYRVTATAWGVGPGRDLDGSFSMLEKWCDIFWMKAGDGFLFNNPQCWLPSAGEAIADVDLFHGSDGQRRNRGSIPYLSAVKQIFKMTRDTDEIKALRGIARKLDNIIVKHIGKKRMLPWDTAATKGIQSLQSILSQAASGYTRGLGGLRSGGPVPVSFRCLYM